MGFPESAIVLALGKTTDLGADCILAELYEDAFAPHPGNWYPRWRLAAKKHAAH